MLKSNFIEHHVTESFGKLVIDYLNHDNFLEDFISYFPEKENILKQIKSKKNQTVDRALLSNTVISQAEKLNLIPTELSMMNQSLLGENNTFTITTAHQPNLLTGPLYIIYKALHTVALAKQCAAWFPDYNFVPVFYIGSEDNDFEELNHFYWEDQKYQIKTTQSGAVGRMNNESVKNIVDEIKKYFNLKIPHQEHLFSIISKAYDGKNNLADAFHIMMHELLGKYGLLLINPDDHCLKKQFFSIMKDELIHQKSDELVIATSELLKTKYKKQAEPRNINLFYLKDDIRNRIVFEENNYKVIETNIVFSKDEILLELENFPERFSPNVILRPLFQEVILPNIITIGGGGELAYWLQLKRVFDFYKVPFPIIVLRQSVAIFPEKMDSLLEKLSLNDNNLWKKSSELLSNMIEEKYSKVLDFESIQKISWELHEQLLDKAKKTDKSLIDSVEAMRTKCEKELSKQRIKLKKSLKHQEFIFEERLKRLKEITHPSGVLQERRHNFMPYFLKYNDELFDNILDNILPFGNQFLIIQE